MKYVVMRHIAHCTLMQHTVISSIRLSKLPHISAVNCGAVTVVGSVLILDLYSRLPPEECSIGGVRCGARVLRWKCTFPDHLSGYPRGIERIPDTFVDRVRQTNNQTLDKFRENAKVMRRLQRRGEG